MVLRHLQATAKLGGAQEYLLYDISTSSWHRTYLVGTRSLEVPSLGIRLNVTPEDVNQIAASVCVYTVDGKGRPVLFGVIRGEDVAIRPKHIYGVITPDAIEVVVPLWSVREHRWVALYRGTALMKLDMRQPVHGVAHSTQIDPCTHMYIFLGAAISDGDTLSVVPVTSIPLSEWIKTVVAAALKDPRELTPNEVRVISVHWLYWASRAIFCENVTQNTLNQLAATGVMGRMMAEQVTKMIREAQQMLGAAAQAQTQQRREAL